MAGLQMPSGLRGVAEGSAPPVQEQVKGSAAEKMRRGTEPGSLIAFLAGESENFMAGGAGNGASGRYSTLPSRLRG